MTSVGAVRIRPGGPRAECIPKNSSGTGERNAYERSATKRSSSFPNPRGLAATAIHPSLSVDSNRCVAWSWLLANRT